MTLPLSLKQYVLRDIKGSIVLITHDAEMAVLLRGILFREGRQTQLDTFISRRRPQSTNVVEHRCIGCAEHHLVSVEATDGPSRTEDVRCELAPAPAMNGRTK